MNTNSLDVMVVKMFTDWAVFVFLGIVAVIYILVGLSYLEIYLRQNNIRNNFRSDREQFGGWFRSPQNFLKLELLFLLRFCLLPLIIVLGWPVLKVVSKLSHLGQ